MAPTEDIEIESSNSHDGVVGIFLVRDQDCTSLVPDKDKVVIGGFGIAELRWASSKEGSVLDIGIVFGRVGDEVVDVMRRLPPSNTQTAAEVGNEYANHGVGNESASDTSMTSIVSGKHDLLPEASKEEGGCKVPFFVEGEEE